MKEFNHIYICVSQCLCVLRLAPCLIKYLSQLERYGIAQLVAMNVAITVRPYQLHNGPAPTELTVFTYSYFAAISSQMGKGP